LKDSGSSLAFNSMRLKLISRRFQTYITSMNPLPVSIVRVFAVPAFRLACSSLEVAPMYTPCPSCNAGRVITKNIGKQTGGLIGAVGGAVSIGAGALSGAQTGAAVGVAAGPVGSVIGSIVGAIIGSLFGGAAGGIAGATLGQHVDEKVLNNYQCLNCGYSFSVTH
jgi:hypothetical protein